MAVYILRTGHVRASLFAPCPEANVNGSQFLATELNLSGWSFQPAKEKLF